MEQQHSIEVTFHGVRGSTPCNSSDVARYGGNTSCVSMRIPGRDPILFDMGTGMRYFGKQLPADGSFRGHVLLSHLHWDHTQGLPFFTPILCPGASLSIHGPAQEDGRTVGEVLLDTIKPPLFPIGLTEFPGKLSFHDVSDTEFTLTDSAPPNSDRSEAGSGDDEISVMSRLIPHVGPTCGYRVTWQGKSVTYMSDHQMPYDGSMSASDSAIELTSGADLLIHDSQYTDAEFAHKSTWGHCTVDYAVWLAAEAGVKTLALFHHDPNRGDDALDALFASARDAGERKGVEVIAAVEGLTVQV